MTVLILCLLLAGCAQQQIAGDWGPKGGGGGGGSGCATSGSAILKGNGTGGCANAASGIDYQAPLGSNPAFTVNTPAAINSNNQTESGTNVTTISVPPPAGITNGDAIVVGLEVAGANSETWTPAAGFSQIGTTAIQIANHKLVQAAFCKVASSESGNYTFSWNNAGYVVALILDIPGVNCSPTAITPTTTNASSLTQAPFAVTTASDLVIAFSGQSMTSLLNGGHVVAITPGTLLRSIEQSFGSVFGAFSMVAGGGNTPAMKVGFIANNNSTAISDDSIFQAFDFVPTASSAQQSVTNGAGGNLNSANISGALNVGSVVQAGSFLLQNASGSPITASPTSGSLNFMKASGYPISGMALNGANNFQIDPSESTAFVTIGNGIKTTNDILLLASGQLDYVSNDASQDLVITKDDTSNNLKFGESGSGGASQENDMYFQVQTGKTFHWSFNNTDDATFNVNAFTLLGGTTLSVHGGTAPTLSAGCNGAGSSVAGTNTAGTITTQTAAATSCTLAFSASGSFANAPTCVFSDGNADATPIAFSTGAEAVGSAVVDFPSASAIKINYVCIGG